LASGLASLDAVIGGGIPIGQITELSGTSSSGKSTLALHACARALDARAAAWIGPVGGFWPLAALECGLSTERLLVLHVPDGLAALRGAQILLGCPSAVAILVVDLSSTFRHRPGQLQALQRLAEHSQTALVLLTERSHHESSLGPAVALRLHVRRHPAEFPRSIRFQVEVLRHKNGPTQQSTEERIHGPDRLCVHCTL
jgi:hypothetical protein